MVVVPTPQAPGPKDLIRHLCGDHDAFFRMLDSQHRSEAFRMLWLSRIWYVGSSIPHPPPLHAGAVHELESLAFSFFWADKRDLVARDVVVHH